MILHKVPVPRAEHPNGPVVDIGYLDKNDPASLEIPTKFHQIPIWTREMLKDLKGSNDVELLLRERIVPKYVGSNSGVGDRSRIGRMIG